MFGSNCNTATAINACCRMAVPMCHVDFGIDIASVRFQIEECKRRYHRDVWNVLCGKALEVGESWKKPENNTEEESGASAAAKAGHANAPSTGAGSTQGDGTATEEEQPEEEAAATSEKTKSVEEVTASTDEAANENNRNRRAARRRTSSSAQRRPQLSQTRRTSGGNGYSSGGLESLDDWHSWSNSGERRRTGTSLLRQPPRPPSRPQSVVGFNNRLTLGGSARTSRTVTVTEQQQQKQQRYHDECDFDDDDEDDCSLLDNSSCGTSESTGLNEPEPAGSGFVPMFCGNWDAAGMGRAARLRRQAVQRRRTRELAITYHEPITAPAGERASRI